MSRDNFGPHLRVSKIRELRGQAGKEKVAGYKTYSNHKKTSRPKHKPVEDRIVKISELKEEELTE